MPDYNKRLDEEDSKGQGKHVLVHPDLPNCSNKVHLLQGNVKVKQRCLMIPRRKNKVKIPRATGEDAVAPKDALEEVEKIDSSSESDCEVEHTTEMQPPTEDVEITSTTSWSHTTTPDGNGNPSKKKKKVSGDTYLADQMVVTTHVVASETSKVYKTLNTKHEMCVSFLAAMGGVNELNDVEKTIYGSKIMARVEHMVVFLNLKLELCYDWVHAMFD
ncbi:hypothetical protein Syun_019502 [Stephania yunnanensis]|uniref:Uncharacterized protein n=1 Tax=Stephania yunnanensis TaxID=152371 RepID=A0AAP0NY19_9MAGN